MEKDISPVGVHIFPASQFRPEPDVDPLGFLVDAVTRGAWIISENGKWRAIDLDGREVVINSELVDICLKKGHLRRKATYVLHACITHSKLKRRMLNHSEAVRAYLQSGATEGGAKKHRKSAPNASSTSRDSSQHAKASKSVSRSKHS